ncbi:PD-(D/E)XK nuclease-like domain-containing protein [Nocardia sp. NPDC046763]|uniref:PD-(D/E)XK nuclease-like domain-containing protein n=1 Tax=Nocardia sp. NPDC046763 TaxID=3155256 RepID=UPI00340C134C
MTTGLISGIPDDDYHASPALSSSGARRLLKVAPAQWLWEQTHPQPPADHFEQGSAVHTLALGVGARVVEVRAKDRRSKAVQQEFEDIRFEGGIPLLSREFDAAHAMAEAARSHPRLGIALRRGEPELSGWWTDTETGVECRLRPDALYRPHGERGRALAVDLKTSESADPLEFVRSVVKFGYDQQHDWIVSGLAAHGIDAACVFLVVSKQPPYLASAVELVPAAVDRGRRRNREALELFRRCTGSGEWPGHGDDIHQIDLPAWAYKQEDHR